VTTISKQLASDVSCPNTSEVYYEYRTTKARSGLPNLQCSPDGQYTYRSLYGYWTDTRDIIHSQGHTRDLAGLRVFSDCIVIDCDTEAEAVATDHLLTELGYGYEQWTTGNRGCHYHIPIHPMFGTDVVWSQRAWLKSVGLWEIIDTSIYREGGQIRTEGAIHEKTGKPKRILSRTKGRLLEVPMVKTPPLSPTVRGVVAGTPAATFDYHRNLLYPRYEGGRHGHMFILWQRGNDAGVDDETIKDDIRWWNDNLAHPPHSVRDLEFKLRGFG